MRRIPTSPLAPLKLWQKRTPLPQLWGDNVTLPPTVELFGRKSSTRREETLRGGAESVGEALGSVATLRGTVRNFPFPYPPQNRPPPPLSRVSPVYGSHNRTTRSNVFAFQCRDTTRCRRPRTARLHRRINHAFTCPT